MKRLHEYILLALLTSSEGHLLTERQITKWIDQWWIGWWNVLPNLRELVQMGYVAEHRQMVHHPWRYLITERGRQAMMVRLTFLSPFVGRR